jgi:hypothetical protein
MFLTIDVSYKLDCADWLKLLWFDFIKKRIIIIILKMGVKALLVKLT